MAGPEAVRLIVGLGNPGSQYQRTRHNAGFWFLDRLAEVCGSRFRHESRWQAEVATAEVAGAGVQLLKPMGFMNRSGQALAAVARYHKAAPEQILVVHDELDFEPGVVRLKVGGGHGGHNGLRDVIALLGSPAFIRLRLGIGRPADVRPVADYVLSKPDSADERLIRNAIERALEHLNALCAGQLDSVMNTLNTA